MSGALAKQCYFIQHIVYVARNKTFFDMKMRFCVDTKIDKNILAASCFKTGEAAAELDGRSFVARLSSIMKRCCQNSLRRRVSSRLVPLILLFIMMSVPTWAGILNGKPAPPFTLKDHAGDSCRLADYQGRPVLLKIGTTWCPSCATQSRELVAALPQLREMGVAVLEVYVEDSPSAVVAYRKEHHLPEAIRTCLDEGGQVLGGYSVVSIPRVLLLDAQHRVRSDQYLLPAKRIVEGFSAMQ